MKKATVEKFRKKLEEERNAILKKPKDGAFDVEHTKGDEVDEANGHAQMALIIRFTERDTQLLRKIDHALLKIRDGRYGECASCDEQIEPKRIEARPTAALCIKCKEEEERRERAFTKDRRVGVEIE